MEPLESLLRQVDDLPTLPDVHLRIVRQLDDPDCDLRDVSDMIALDAVLSGRVIRIANSALFGASGRTDSLRGAILRIGTRDTRNAVLTAAVMDVLSPSSAALDPREFWSLGLASAMSARQLSRDLGHGGLEQAYLGGLVHSLGEAVLALYFPDRYLRAIEDARASQCALVEAVWSEFGFTHPVLCARLLEKWNFAPQIVEAVEYHLDPGEAPNEPLLATILLCADRMCRELGFGITDPGTPEHSWVGDIPDAVVEQLLNRGHPDLDEYIAAQKDQLQDVTSLVQAVFSGR